MPVSLTRPKIYYELENFYANHRKFVKSRSFKQLAGKDASDLETSCTPITTFWDLYDTMSKDKLQKLSQMTSADMNQYLSQQAYPCGLIGKYIFNDTYQIIKSVSRKVVKIDETNIAHDVDRNYRFKARNKDSYIDIENEHTMVWYQMESFSNFIKLYGHINTQLKVNETYIFIIEDNYQMDNFDGKKYIYLSEVNDFGGKNLFLGIALLVMSGVVVILMAVLTVCYCYKVKSKENYYDPDTLDW
eukprot:403336051